MSKKILLIDASFPDECRIAISEDSLLVNFDSQNTDDPQSRGNIYMGKVHKIESSLQAAFIELTNGEYGFLPFSEIIIRYFNVSQDVKQELLQIENHYEIYKKFNIGEILKHGDNLLVQVSKDKRYNKCVTLTTRLKIPGRYCVLIPYSNDCIISKQISDEQNIERLKQIALKNFDLKKNSGVILRAYAENISEKQIV